MTGVMRRAISLLCGNQISRPFLSSGNIYKYQHAGLVLKQFRDFDYPPPFPYKDKPYGVIDSYFDSTTWRFNENSKIIIVDGPVACGKTKLAKEIAEAFDLLYMPHVNLDSYYINSYGYDMRKLNDKLPFKCKSFDIHEFLQNPFDKRATIMQHHIYTLRMGQYIDALNHVLNTGQGVVLDRSFYSSAVFEDTFIKFGFLPETYATYVAHINQAVAQELLKPHLIIYLDSPVDVTLERIKKRNLPGENNSPVYKPEVLKYMEASYKNFLKKMEKKSELLVYDWSVEQNSEIVMEDLEEINLDDYHFNDPKMEQWRKEAEFHWNSARIRFSKEKESYFICWCNSIPYLECEDIYISGNDREIYNEVWYNAPGMKYAPGYNVDMGDPNPMWHS